MGEAQEERCFSVSWEPAPKAVITLDVDGRSGNLDVDIKIKVKRLSGTDAAAFAKHLERVAALAKRIDEIGSENLK